MITYDNDCITSDVNLDEATLQTVRERVFKLKIALSTMNSTSNTVVFKSKGILRVRVQKNDPVELFNLSRDLLLSKPLYSQKGRYERWLTATNAYIREQFPSLQIIKVTGRETSNPLITMKL